jgi:hypothetical protein
MVKKFLILVLFVLVFSGISSAFEYSADFTITTRDQGKTSGKMYAKQDKFRMDFKYPDDVSAINRLDKKILWNVMHREKMYIEMPLDQKNKPRVEEKFEGEIERKLVGKETIDGHPAEKYLITYIANDTKQQVYQWWATDIRFPVKTSAVDGSWEQEYKNIKIGSQPDSLFEVPAGYTKFQMPGGMNFRTK